MKKFLVVACLLLTFGSLSDVNAQEYGPEWDPNNQYGPEWDPNNAQPGIEPGSIFDFLFGWLY